MKVTRIDVQVLGERGYPVASGRMVEEQCKDFPTICQLARGLNPLTTDEDVIRAIWRYGTRKLQDNLLHRVPIKVETLPGVRPEPEASSVAAE